MSLNIRRAAPCLALIVSVVLAACSGGDPVSPARSAQGPSLGKARAEGQSARKGDTTATTQGTSCAVLPVDSTTTPTDTTKTTTKRCETAPWH